MCFQVKLQLGIGGIRDNSNVSPGWANVKKVNYIFDKVLH